MAASITSILTPASHHHPAELTITCDQAPHLAEGCQKREQRKDTPSSAPTRERARTILAPDFRAHPSNQQPHLLIISSFSGDSKHIPADKHIKRIRHHLFPHSIPSSLESRRGNSENPASNARVQQRRSFLISFIFV